MRSPLLKKEITTMANKKKLAKTTPDDRKKRAATKARVKKLKLQLRSMEKALSDPVMIWHRG
jgi:hypothetical protein